MNDDRISFVALSSRTNLLLVFNAPIFPSPVLHVSCDTTSCAICSFWNCFEIMLMTLSFFSRSPIYTTRTLLDANEHLSAQLARKYHFYSYFMRLSIADILFIYIYLFVFFFASLFPLSLSFIQCSSC